MDTPDTPQPGSWATASATSERMELSNEWHARPNINLPAPFRCTHLVALHEGSSAGDAHRKLGELCASHGQSTPAAGSRYHILEAGSCLIKWESHTEATSHTILVAGNGQPAFGETAIDFLDTGWREILLGEMFVGVQVEILSGEDPTDPHGF